MGLQGSMMVFAAQWVVLYDVRRDGPGSEILFPLVGLIVVAVALFGIRRRHFVRGVDGETHVVRGSRRARVFFGCALAWFCLAAAMTVLPIFQLRRALNAHRYAVVQGSVENYVEANLLKKTPEKWTVDGHRYEFYDARVKSGFDELGVVHGGMYVRLADVNGRIARLEATQESLSGLPSNDR